VIKPIVIYYPSSFEKDVYCFNFYADREVTSNILIGLSSCQSCTAGSRPHTVHALTVAGSVEADGVRGGLHVDSWSIEHKETSQSSWQTRLSSAQVMFAKGKGTAVPSDGQAREK